MGACFHAATSCREPEGLPDIVPALFREGNDYYRTPRAQHSGSANRLLVRSMDLIVNYFSVPLQLFDLAAAIADDRGN